MTTATAMREGRGYVQWLNARRLVGTEIVSGGPVPFSVVVLSLIPLTERIARMIDDGAPIDETGYKAVLQAAYMMYTPPTKEVL